MIRTERGGGEGDEEGWKSGGREGGPLMEVGYDSAGG